MVLAIPYNDDGTIFEHTGRTEVFKIYEIENQEIKKSYLLPTNGLDHEYLAGLLKNENVSALICSHIGSGMLQILRLNGIKVYAAVTGMADEAAQTFVEGILKYDANPTCQCGEEGHHHPDGCGCGCEETSQDGCGCSGDSQDGCGCGCGCNETK
jgi:predicted Fe-Mo cluster-binding NifX family protein